MKKSQFWIIAILLLLVFGLGYYAYSLNTKSENVTKNTYDYAFSELVNYVNNIENYLAKAMISRSSKHSAQTLTKIWSDANLSIVYIENIPFDEKGTSQSIKYLNQVSDYSYALSRKAIDGVELTEEDFNNLKTLYKYAIDFKNTLNEMALELNAGVISWDNLESTSSLAFANEEDINVFSSIESNFDDYEGLIYDGAYSDYIVKNVKLGITGEELDETGAKTKIEEYFGKENIEQIEKIEGLTGGEIDAFNFSIKLKEKMQKMDVEISTKGGWIVEIINDREVVEEKISNEEAIKKGKEFLDKLGYKNMQETYSLKQENIVTINYAYKENEIVMYPDLIKVKIALDDGEVLGMEANGYLNTHTTRNFLEEKITIEDAKQKLNTNLEILSEGKAVIPLDNNKEAYCYEFKGKVEDKQFLVYINAQTGEEEEILVLLETEGGTLTI